MRKVFVVEDDRFITAIFTMFLRDLGHEFVGRTGSGKEALEKCRELRPDVVLMDIHLEGDLDGIQTAEMLKRELEVPIIYISSDTSSQVIERAIVSNSYGYLVKPINKKELGISIDLAYYKHKVDLEQKQREQSYREFISDSPMPIVVVRNGNVMYLNRLGLDVFKTHYIEDVISTPIKNYVHEDSYEEFCEVIDSFVSADKRIQPFLAKMKTVHGDLYWAEITGSKVNFNNQQSLQLIIRDVSQDKLNEKKVLAQNNALFEINKPYFVLNAAMDVIQLNQNARELLKGEDILGNNITNYITSNLDWIDLLKDKSYQCLDKHEVEISFLNQETKKFNLHIVCSISGNIAEILLVEKCL
ncbi:response regulator [Labilibacter sediminis]|nr:response regulator [Labilibacter sediminis]